MSLSSTAEQIICLYKMRETPASIAKMLSIKEEEVLIILQARGLLSVDNISKFQESKDTPKLSINTSTHIRDIPEIDTENKSPKEIYESYQILIAKNLCRIGSAVESQDMPIGVIVKAGIYVNEEATGRNEIKAKKNSNNTMLLDMANIMKDIALAKSQVSRALGIVENTDGDTSSIDVLCEKVS